LHEIDTTGSPDHNNDSGRRSDRAVNRWHMVDCMIVFSQTKDILDTLN